ncbi:Mediator of RNA polymerase II transcription subunit 14 [Desmophyllum pertusum]|uniref:Mediator of RNA polymerase II transcription subunit 14 n=1 Tax=Desmophyllum pertusum TaxID=174260 RepID=A0A9W9Y6Y6_9CNID|nr:Mediator of RNA polymerase II transcription subunit 14 [Desmophyllum pertusum]
MCSPAPVLTSVRRGPPVMLSALERVPVLHAFEASSHSGHPKRRTTYASEERTELFGIQSNPTTTNLQYVVGVDPSYTALRLSAKSPTAKVVCAPYKASAITAFARLLGAPASILRDCIKIMKLELIQLSRPIPSSPTGEEQIVVVPILHDIQNNTIQQAEMPRQATPAAAGSSVIVQFSQPCWRLVRNLDIPP